MLLLSICRQAGIPRDRWLVFGAVALSAPLWAQACGDAGTEPQPPADPRRPTTVTVTPATAELTAIEATVQLTAEVRDQNGNVMTGAAVTWSSSNASAAAVDGLGLVTAVANGTATVTATAGAVSAMAMVTVAQMVSSVTVTPAADTLVEADTLRVAGEAADAHGHLVAGAAFEWASSDTTVAAVDDSGLVTGVGAGEVTVTATSSGVTGSAELIVVAPAPTTVAVIPDTVAFTAIGQTAQLAAEVRDQAGRTMGGVAVTWSSGDTLVVVTDSAGLVTTVGGGAATVTAAAGEASGEAAVTVMQSAGSVTVTPAADTVALGDTLRLVADAYDANGHRVDEAVFTWSSSDASVATVDGSGLVRGVAEGMATISAVAGDARGASEITVENPDRPALVALYEATDGPNWVNNENWLTDAPLGDWYGVRTDGSGRVVQLDLGGRWDSENGRWVQHGLSGSIPPELGSLANLTRLYLGSNDLTGPIPPEFGNLANLTRLRLYGNNLSGPIPPEFGNLANLSRLDLGRNDLTGPIPPELGNLANLTLLGLGRNDLTGPIPPELGNLANLTLLGLPFNDLSGLIPPELGSLANLETLSLYANNLTGAIPPELGNLGTLEGLYLNGNDLAGPVPPELGSLTDLTWLNLSRNELSGPIPSSFLQLGGLDYFSIAGNESLCVPGIPPFVAWLERIEHRDREASACNASDVRVLTALFEATGGSGWTHSGGWLGDFAVGEWYGVSADSLGHVTALDLARNGLAGRLSQNLGGLARMTKLRIGGNTLSGRLPLSLVRVPLQEFRYAGTELCAPVEESFQEWLNAIPAHEGTGVDCAPLSDRDILEVLYDATNGAGWANSENWLSEAQLGEWHGVRVDEQGRVVELRFRGNDLSGPIPPELGNLANLRVLSLDRNHLTGRIPPELGSLANLTRLDLSWNELSGPIPAELGSLANLTLLDLAPNRLSGPIPFELGSLAKLTWLNLSHNELSGPIPAELGSLANLTGLFLSSNGFSGPIPFELGNHANLTRLDLSHNDLSDRIPAELGNLANLIRLHLQQNALTGPIPPELGDLANVTELHLHGNVLTGPIPAELGGLARLEELYLAHNDLTGPIPPEIGNLTNATILWFTDNNLSGQIPPELGNLRSVTFLGLDENTLAATVPPELGNLATLEQLRLQSNDLSGPVPPAFGGMSRLQELALANNSGMAGPLPIELTALGRLDALQAGGTELCTPTDPGFQDWLRGVYKRRIANCVAGDPPAAYLVQAVQSREFPVPLVAGERALLRVFVTTRQATSKGIPPVRARFYRDDRETHVVDIPGTSTPIPTEVDESSLSKSANAEIPGDVVQPRLEMVLEIDPEGTLDPELGVAKRIPETGRLEVDVQEMPLFDLTLIPFVWTETHDSSIVDLNRAMAADPYDHAMFSDMHLLPVGEMRVTAHEPVLSSSNNVFDLLSQTAAIRAMEGGAGHYKGMMSRPLNGGAGGVAHRPGRSSFSGPSLSTIAHELGHNLSLFHAPCGGALGPDPSFPYADGSIGSWGYDFRNGGGLVRPSTPDLMSYCGPPDGVSDYHFANALRFRLSEADGVGLPDRSPRAKALLLWGGVGADGVPDLEPAFVVDAPPSLPQSGGPYRLTGETRGGTELFSFAFTMPEVADGDGSSSFAFVLPVGPGWESDLASITLAGPGGSVTLDGDPDLPMAILRNPRTGQIRGILRDLPETTLSRAAAGAMIPRAQALEVLVSRGIPEGEAWRR